MEASQVLEKHEDEFFEVVDAKLKLRWLRRKKVVPDSLVADIESSHGEKAKELLFEHLHLNANAVTLREYCNMLSGADAYPKMQKLGQKMLHDLPPEGSVAPVARPIIIHDIIVDYISVKGTFVGVCTTKGTPTLDEVKARCIDLIAAVCIDMPQIVSQIKNAQNMEILAHIVCFSLSRWVSYDFFQQVITHFQPALENVKERLKCYEDQLKPLLLQKLNHIAKLRLREDAPGSMAKFVVKYRLDADGLSVKDLIAERDFLAQRLGIPEHLLQVLTWEEGSVVVTYWLVRDLLPLAELALCREDVRAELIKHGVEEVYLGSHPSEHPGPVEQSLLTLHLQRRAIVTVLDAHRQDLEVTSLTSDLKDTGVLTAEQCQKLASLDDKERRHEALLYTLLASERPDTFHKLVGCMELRDASTAAKLQATFRSLVESPGALSVISSSSQCSPESPEERTVSQVVETMGGEVPPQQTEQAEPSRGCVQPHLEEERFAGEPRQEDGVSHPQLEEGASGKGALELELAEAREAKERLEGEVRRLHEELERNVTELTVAKDRLKEDVRQLQAMSVQVDEYFELQEQHKELERRYRSTEDERVSLPRSLL